MGATGCLSASVKLFRVYSPHILSDTTIAMPWKTSPKQSD